MSQSTKYDDARALAHDERMAELGQTHVEGFCDWIANETYGHPAVQNLELCELTPQDFNGKSAAEVLAVALDQGQKSISRLSALDWLIEQHEAVRAADRAASQARLQAMFEGMGFPTIRRAA